MIKYSSFSYHTYKVFLDTFNSYALLTAQLCLIILIMINADLKLTSTSFHEFLCEDGVECKVGLGKP